MISRDRGGSYAEGAAAGAPDAIRVADRWHLLKNLGDALASLFDEHRSMIEQHLRASTDQTGTPAPEQKGMAELPRAVPMPPSSPAPLPKRQQEQQQRRRERRLMCYEAVCQLRAQGRTLSAIADEIGLDRATVCKYVQAVAFPEHQPRQPRASLLDPFKPYLLQRWNAGCHTGAVLLREIERQGYHGGASTCLAYITHLRRASGLPPKKRSGAPAQTVAAAPPRLPSPRGLAWLVLRRAETLEEADQDQFRQLCAAHADITVAIRLAQEFSALVRERQPDQLDPWLARTEQSGIASLVSFAKGIRRDYAAVKAGITLEFSNGPTEGHINRLKMVKREMFGRAKLDLLKMRLIAA